MEFQEFLAQLIEAFQLAGQSFITNGLLKDSLDLIERVATWVFFG